MPQRLLAEYATKEAFLAAFDAEISNGGLLIRGAQPSEEPDCLVEVRVEGNPPVEAAGQIGASGRFGVTVTFEGVPKALADLAERLRGGATEAPAESPSSPEPAHRGTVAERLAALTVAQKIQAAMSGDRETRLALFRDHNKTLHAFVLRNPRIQLDEVVFAVKLATLSPDAFKIIAEHPEWGGNLTICTAIVRNPRSPTPVALRLLPRLPQTEIRAIAKGGARDQLVFAARKMLSG
jgi:hypothetical protein